MKKYVKSNPDISPNAALFLLLISSMVSVFIFRPFIAKVFGKTDHKKYLIMKYYDLSESQYNALTPAQIQNRMVKLELAMQDQNFLKSSDQRKRELFSMMKDL